MQKAHAVLRSKLVVVAVPVRGILWAGPTVEDMVVMTEFLGRARRGFVNAPENMEPISPCVFTVSDGQVVGIVQGFHGERPSELDMEHVEPAIGFPWPVRPANGAQP
jgi:hypothetical protein